ncbi:MAG: hypothetical protein KKD44_26190 [Proteobacteria bacterium]|nr:hypothetical protein [Pseudomonadota bacterium]
MKYSRGKWIPYAFGIQRFDNNNVSHEVLTIPNNTKMDLVELQNNTEIACAAVNVCASINPNNPMAVVESIKTMYEMITADINALYAEYCHLKPDPTTEAWDRIQKIMRRQQEIINKEEVTL